MRGSSERGEEAGKWVDEEIRECREGMGVERRSKLGERVTEREEDVEEGREIRGCDGKEREWR